MSRVVKSNLFIITISIFSLFLFAPSIEAQTDTPDLMMYDMTIHAELGTDCDTIIILESEFISQDVLEISSFELRIDVRGLSVNRATINGSAISTTTESIDNYLIIMIHPNSPILPGTSGHLFLNFTTQCLQERIGVSDEGTMYISHLIYYIRPLYEIHNLTFSAALPQHAIIDLNAAAPLFPKPITNHTDGSRTVYVWYTDILLPGQETVYIIKYQIPIVLINTQIQATSNPYIMIIAVAIVTSIAILVIERLPRWVKHLNSRELIVSGTISSQEQDILDLLNTKGGSCSQREIYENLDMSQSMASLMLTSLEGRGLIRRLRKGRENIVHIMED